ncbi:MAG: hypothetical protein GF401_20765 [Chitinivibrionales bacterium]|nr:hypothetical protein [Chitinivibrionales bacterium]
MNEEIITYLRAHPEGVSSTVLAEEFLKFKNPVPAMAHCAVSSILTKDRRCVFSDDNRWHVVEKSRFETPALKDLPWTAVYCLPSPAATKPDIIHVSLWNIFPSPRQVLSLWLRDPATYQSSGADFLCADTDLPFTSEIRERNLRTLTAYLDGRIPVYLSRLYHSLLLQQCLLTGEQLTDESMLVSQLMYHAGVPVPKPLTVESVYTAVLNQPPLMPNVRKCGEAFADCVYELFSLCAKKNIENREELEQSEEKALETIDFSRKAFSYGDIVQQPRKPGVYAFKQEDSTFLYIGKAKNLRRRLTGYFINTEESPAKLKELREKAYSLNTFVCGSELEALIYEYRLINKHAPLLNKQIAINERKGAFTPLNDCIVLLPHADDTKGVSFWFKKDQKVKLKEFDADLSTISSLSDELEDFFFKDKVPVSPQDFPEIEIATRWVRRNEEHIVVVPAAGAASPEEIIIVMKHYWKDSRESVTS